MSIKSMTIEATEIANAQLAGDFFRRFQVGVERSGFDVAALRGARRVDIDRYQRFGVIDHDAAARGQVKRCAQTPTRSATRSGSG